MFGKSFENSGKMPRVLKVVTEGDPLRRFIYAIMFGIRVPEEALARMADAEDAEIAHAAMSLLDVHADGVQPAYLPDSTFSMIGFQEQNRSSKKCCQGGKTCPNASEISAAPVPGGFAADRVKRTGHLICNGLLMTDEKRLFTPDV